MKGRFARRPSPAMVVACTALGVALGGSSYAAVEKLVPRNSVGSAQVINHSLKAVDLARGVVRTGKRGPAGPQGPKGDQGDRGDTGPKGATGPAGALATVPIDVSYDATRSTGHTLTADGVTLSLECGNNRIGPNQANLVVYAKSTHGATTATEYTATASSTTTTMVNAEKSTPVALGDVGVGGTNVYGTAYFDGVLELDDGSIDYLHVWWTRDTRQTHPVCAFQGSIVETGSPTVVPG